MKRGAPRRGESAGSVLPRSGRSIESLRTLEPGPLCLPISPCSLAKAPAKAHTLWIRSVHFLSFYFIFFFVSRISDWWITERGSWGNCETSLPPRLKDEGETWFDFKPYWGPLRAGQSLVLLIANWPVELFIIGPIGARLPGVQQSGAHDLVCTSDEMRYLSQRRFCFTSVGLELPSNYYTVCTLTRVRWQRTASACRCTAKL